MDQNNSSTRPRYDSVFRAGLFDSTVILITGGGTGIGRSTAHEFAALGATVVVAARRPEPLTETQLEIAEAGGTADTVTLNVRDSDSVSSCVEEVVRRHGKIDVLVNNAGGQFPSPVEAMSPNGWRTVIDLNLNGTFLMTREVFAASMKEHGGVVVSVVADMWSGFPGMAHTGAARAGVVNMTKSMAVEWGPHGVRVNAVAPGTIYSSGMDTYDKGFAKVAAAKAGKIPAGRVGTESETSAAIVFLATPAAAYITGETLKVDGGSSLAKEQWVTVTNHNELPPYDGFHLSRQIPEEWRG